MKKILAAILVLALVAPAMANVAVTATDAGSQQLLISFATTDTSVVRGIALTLNVTGASVTGAPSVLASSFNTYIDYAFNGSVDPYTIGAGHPLAKETQAGVAAFPINAGTAFAVSVGYLAPAGQLGLTSGTVIKLQLTGIPNGGSATVAISANATRGGAVVGDNLGTVTVQPSQVIAGPVVTECVKSTAPFYADWVAFGKPACWCFSRNCRGDINGTGVGTSPGKKWITTTDLTAFKLAFNIANSALPAGGICADLNHAGVPATYSPTQKRVTTTDLTTFKLYFNKAENDPVNPVTICPMDNYNFWTN